MSSFLTLKSKTATAPLVAFELMATKRTPLANMIHQAWGCYEYRHIQVMTDSIADYDVKLTVVLMIHIPLALSLHPNQTGPRKRHRYCTPKRSIVEMTIYPLLRYITTLDRFLEPYLIIPGDHGFTGVGRDETHLLKIWIVDGGMK